MFTQTKMIQKTVILKPRYHFEMETQLKTNDYCSIEVPYEMSCDGNINPALDGSNCIIKSLNFEEASVILENSTEMFTLPLFCLKKRNLKPEALNKVLSKSPSNSNSSKKPKKTINNQIFISSCKF
jgi:hypothetical protein